MITAPLVMPDVITGLSLLLLFVALAHAIGWPADRGMLTIWLAHVTFVRLMWRSLFLQDCGNWIAR